ncbi:FxsA family protein [Rummeliibacillus suwonensis]|jgi:Protein affecting phage T7 exclusion by the F plasmid|uniref:FxsA family protein n=1 Tax=Rummeliibacillus suwonensis TaxID=1306154 RepID=UPI0011B5B689|nr:FxsA family protein [Rummeliibacillus suwonensis]MBO2536913.1 membrane protein FxsA [Rummeliibacillus suwonensis]
MRKFLMLLIAVPIVEIAVVLLSGKLIGAIPTLLLIVGTGVLGVYLAKTKGLNAFQQLKREIEKGRAPGDAIIDGVLTFIGSIVLILPGFISDIIGILLVIPITRKLFKPAIYYWLRKKMKNGQIILIQK